MQAIPNSKPIVTPKTWNPKDVYLEYAAKLLCDNPSYWGKYSRVRKMKNFWIYTIVDSKVVEVINFDRWKQVVSSYFKSARKHITLHGSALNIGNYVGRIEPRRVERNHANKQIDFKATNLRPKVLDPLTGKYKPDTLVFHTDDDWIRIAWVKTGHITNETAYKFSPCNGDKDSDGFKEQFSKENLTNPSLKYTYKYFPYIRQRKLKLGAA